MERKEEMLVKKKKEKSNHPGKVNGFLTCSSNTVFLQVLASWDAAVNKNKVPDLPGLCFRHRIFRRRCHRLCSATKRETAEAPQSLGGCAVKLVTLDPSDERSEWLEPKRKLCKYLEEGSFSAENKTNYRSPETLVANPDHRKSHF